VPLRACLMLYVSTLALRNGGLGVVLSIKVC